MIFRPTVESDLDRFLPLITADAASSTMTVDAYREKLADGQYRFDLTWIAVDDAGGDPLAVAIWWSGSGSHPEALDGVFVDAAAGTLAERTDLAAGLLIAAHAGFAAEGTAEPPAYHVFLPSDWRDQPDVVEALTWRREAARRAGLPASLERLRFEWTPDAGIEEPSGRLVFRSEPDDEVFVELFRRVLTDSLDATSRAEAEHIGTEAQARSDVAFYRDVMLGDRSWWRVAETPDGDVVGFGVSSRNRMFPVVGYLGVVPEHRGCGYVGEILSEITRLLSVELTAERIRADTDLANAPMAAAFERAGYRNFARRLVLSAH